MDIELLDFFRTGAFGGARSGMSRSEVEARLGPPNVSWIDDYKVAPIWFYAGVQFHFADGDTLNDISFWLWYLSAHSSYREVATERTKLDRWIFLDDSEPDIDQFTSALQIEDLEFRDTGLETHVYDEELRTFVAGPYQPDLDDAESFGTIVLDSGVQVRYGNDRSIIRVSDHGDTWLVKGKRTAC